MKVRVTVESPYAGDVDRNVAYLKRALLDSVNRGEAPLASHLFYTQFLDDAVPFERETGIDCGLTWAEQAQKMCFYVDYGFTTGMLRARAFALRRAIEMEERSIGENRRQEK